MRKKILMCLGVLILVLVIVLAVILCIKVNKNEDDVIIDNENIKDVEIYTPTVPEENGAEPAEKEIANTLDKKAEINKKLSDEMVQLMINSKTISTIYKEGKLLINEFNSGIFTDEEKFKVVYSKLDFSDEVNIYSVTPELWVKTEEIEKASREIFGENINILNLKYALIKDGKVEYTIPTDISIKIFKVKSAILDRSKNTCTVTFDMLKYSADYLPYNVVDYKTEDVLATFELKAEKQENGSYIVRELNKI